MALLTTGEHSIDSWGIVHPSVECRTAGRGQAWDDLLAAWVRRDWEAVLEYCEALIQWLDKDGFPPEFRYLLDLGKDFNRAFYAKYPPGKFDARSMLSCKTRPISISPLVLSRNNKKCLGFATMPTAFSVH